MCLHIEIEDGVAIVTVNNPPVNAINKNVRCGLLEAMDVALAGKAKSMVITGRGKAFVAGADAKEFDAPPQEPHLNDVLSRLASLPIPTICAINGVALGGGLEIALACRYRVASPSASLGLPEVTLGIVPGAGGTQRLPRAVGLTKAIELVGFGKAIRASEALAIGLIHAVADDPVAFAKAVDLTVLSEIEPLDLMPTPTSDTATVQHAVEQVVRKSAGQIAPKKAVDLVLLAGSCEISEGLAKERATFLELRGSEQARAFRHVFFAERAAVSRGSNFPSPERELRTALVVGGGNMGAAIAYALASSGLSVTILETDNGASARANENADRILEQGRSRGLLTDGEAQALKARISHRVRHEKLEVVDIAIEAAFEDMAVKKAIFASLIAILPDTTILATNTSYLDVNELASEIPNPGRFVGLHFFSPAHIMKLLEIVRGDHTSPETLGVAYALAKALRKVPVLSGVCDGFIGNRILARYRQAADILLLEGATPYQIDEAMRAFGMAMGPYEAQDMSGLDIAYANRKRQNLRKRTDVRYVPIADRLVENHKRLGRKSEAGWYDYEGGKPAQSPTVIALLERASHEARVERRAFRLCDIQERTMIAMIAEAASILEEGIAERSEDIDLVLMHGYGFPRWRGGLLHYADTIGSKKLLARMEELSAQDPISWPIPDIIGRLASSNSSFSGISETIV
ncbi:3-hydroxyacyl-CoA dehydrogenase [Rhizobium wenxiniae]|uniref:FAD-dependent oxidoreductase n=1 Tax=Rhizobium wenxiniae TaxID=1737357 RepID=UPI00161B19D9|nr:FAD-dependent oxidoreductase [Rhizobium wenxiniae]GGG13987.1 3-hydroxyacyl-CoA dehydrogenase [Rhizobium wenxiniae]